MAKMGAYLKEGLCLASLEYVRCGLFAWSMKSGQMDLSESGHTGSVYPSPINWHTGSLGISERRHLWPSHQHQGFVLLLGLLSTEPRMERITKARNLFLKNNNSDSWETKKSIECIEKPPKSAMSLLTKKVPQSWRTGRANTATIVKI